MVREAVGRVCKRGIDGEEGGDPWGESLWARRDPLFFVIGFRLTHPMRRSNKMLTAAGMPEGYTLKDLVKPDRIKVQKALSGIINLQKFRESVQDDYDAHVQKSVRAVE